MPLRLDVKKIMSATSERVKCLDVHPQEPWIVCALYTGHIQIWNYTNSTVVKSFEVTELPIRCVKFVARKQWIVCGADDTQIRVYNYNTTERVKMFEAHTDYLRSLAVHPTLPYLLSSSDDMTIKMWNWDQNWVCVQTFEGHNHYVMQVEFNPKDTNTFASASLDRTIKVWGINSATPHFSLEGHERGVNCISYFAGGDKPFILTGADDSTIKVWDYQTKACVATLEGHTNNVSSVLYHPVFPIIISGSEDGTVRIWHSSTYRLENTLNYGMERAWSLACVPNANKLAIGYDEGTIMVKLGQDEPVISMDNTGKIVFAKNHEFNTAHVKQSLSGDAELVDGERLLLATKDAGACEIYPQSLEHSPNGRFLSVCGDGEFIIYTALALKNKSYGQALEFVWAQDSGSYAVRESSSRIKIFKDFKEHKAFRPQFAAEGIFGGALLAIRSNEFVDFYDWDELRLIRRIAVCPKRIMWSGSGDLVVIACESSFYTLRYRSDLVQKYFEQAVPISDQGIEDAFDVEVEEISEKIRTGKFIGDCFLYNNSAGRLNYMVGGQVMILSHLDRPMYLIGYLQKENRVYLCDKQQQIISYQLLLSILVYQAAVVRGDLESAQKIFLTIPKEHHNKLAHFLEGQDLKELALKVTTDLDHQFELACQLQRLDIARSVLEASTGESSTDLEHKWRQVGDLALAKFDLQVAEDCFKKCDDLSALLLVYSAQGNAAGMCWLAKKAAFSGRFNIAFTCSLLTNQIDQCVQILIDSNRIPEAAFFARTYKPSLIPTVVDQWRENLRTVNERAALSLADSNDYPDSFTDLSVALQVESILESKKQARTLNRAYMFSNALLDDATKAVLAALQPAIAYADCKGETSRNLVEEAKSGIFVDEIEVFEDALECALTEAAIVNVPASVPLQAEKTFSTPVKAALEQSTFSPLQPPVPKNTPFPVKTATSFTLVASAKNSIIEEDDLDLDEVDAIVAGTDINQFNDAELDLDDI